MERPTDDCQTTGGWVAFVPLNHLYNDHELTDYNSRLYRLCLLFLRWR